MTASYRPNCYSSTSREPLMSPARLRLDEVGDEPWPKADGDDVAVLAGV